GKGAGATTSLSNRSGVQSSKRRCVSARTRRSPTCGPGSRATSSSSINVAHTAGSAFEPRIVFSLLPCLNCNCSHPAPFHLSQPPDLSHSVRPPLLSQTERHVEYSYLVECK